MGILDRLGKIATGVGGALQAPVGLVYDLARAPFVDDDELDGFVNVLYGRTVARGGQFIGNLAGPQEGLGAAIGALPSAVRAPVRAVADPVMAGLETAGRETIREPLTALMTAASLQQAGEGFNLREGYRIAQHRSLGQAVALAFLTEDITDDAEVAAAEGTDWYQGISGTMDAAARLFLDVDVLAGKVSKGFRRASITGEAIEKTTKLGRLGRALGVGEEVAVPAGAAEQLGAAIYRAAPERLRQFGGRMIRTGADVEAALADPRLQVVNDRIRQIRDEAGDVNKASARIRDLAFHDHRDGAFISRMLAESDDLDTTWGALMGHRPSMENLWAQQADVAGRISRLQGEQAIIAELRRMGIELPDSIKVVEKTQLDAELSTLYDTETRLAHNAQAVGTVREMPRISGMSERRATFTRSDFFQRHPAAAPLRLAINMRPRNFVDLHDAAGDAQVARLLRKARLPIEEQDRLRGLYMAAADPTARNTALAEAEAASIRVLAERHGITDADEIDKLINQAANGRTAASGQIANSRKYDGAGRSYIEDVDDKGVTHRIYVPLAATQEFNQFILPDLDAIDEIFKRRGQRISRFGTVTAGATEMLEAYQRLWKPSVLLRVGWPIRVVGEEQIRVMSQIGALNTAGRSARAGGRYLADLGVDAINNFTQAVRRIPKEERTFRGGLSADDAAARRGLRLGNMNIRGLELESSYGTNETFNDIYRSLNSARGSLDPVVKTADQIREGLRREVMGEWQSLEPTMPGYGQAWENAVNHQVGQDAMWKQFLQGKTRDEVKDWLDTTEGRAYLKRVPHWKRKVDDWLEIAEQTVDDYLPTDELRALALEGKATIGDLERVVPDAAGRPLVNGAVVLDVKGKTRFAMALGNLRDQTMKVLGGTPTDVLSRNPYFDWHYTEEVKRLVNIAADQGVDLTPEFARYVEGKARNYALGESKKLLYDLADESELGEFLRFVSPFYSAWQEVLTRWTGITVDNPAFVARMHEIWRSPEKAGIVTDENGATVHADGTATSALGETVEAGKDRYINMRLLATDNAVGKKIFDDLLRHIPGTKRLETATFNKDSLNTILQGAPGVGPLIQIPLNEVAKARPDLEQSLSWALPFGASQSTLDMILPATARRIKTKAGGEEDRLYSNQLMRIYWDAQVDYNLGKRADAPTYAEAKKKTDSLYNLRTMASFISPVSPTFQSPYQMYIDAYRALKEKDPENADELFLSQYGDEFFPLTQSLSRSMDGVPPTLEGAAARKKYVDLIEKHPELGGLIVGSEGAGEFVSSVYQSQLSQPLRPGSPDKQRQAFSFEEAQSKPNERLGWIEYSKAMDLIDAERMNRGLANLQVRAARDLADLKRNVIGGLAKKYPEWYAQFSVTDRNAWSRKMDGLRDIAADDRLAGRAEIRQLRQYLQARETILDELAARKAAGGASTLTSATNIDLAGLWTRITTYLTDANPAFSQLYYRYLERDPMTPETRTEVA